MRAGRVAAVAVLLTVVGGSIAAAAPTTPVFAGTAPPFVSTATPTLSWSAVTFDAGSTGQTYSLAAKNLTQAVPDVTAGALAPALSATLPALINGHQYSVSMIALDTTVTCLPFPVNTCIPFPQFSGTSAPITFRLDTTAPTGTMKINSGDTSTNKRDVTLNLTASDPLSNGQPPSGVGFVQATQTGAFSTCATPSAECPTSFSASVPLTLAPGADGLRTVSARFLDKAAVPCVPGGTPTCPTITGNPSATVTDTILLDRQPPTVSVAVNSPAPKVGTPFSFSAAASRDGAGGSDDSGIDPAGFTWSFGDGTTGTGSTVGHVYRKPGTFTGTVTVRDRAGNFASQTFTVNVPGIVKTVIDAGKVIQAKLRFRIAAQGDSLRFLQLNVTGAKKGAKVAVSCKAGCAVKKNLTAKGATVSLTRLFARGLKKPPIKVEVRVSKAGLVGKVFKYTFRPTGVTAIECNLLTSGKTSGCSRA